MSHEKAISNAPRMKLVQDMLKGLHAEITPASTILDFGCGDGELVHQFRKEGYQAYGIDIEDFYNDVEKQCREEGLMEEDETFFHSIDLQNYTLPFADNTFDCIFSFYVLEHAQNWSEALAEIQRILKPGGTCLHIFPSKYCPIEPHIFVPFACLLQSYPYLAIWAFLGIKNSYQKSLHWQEVAAANFHFLRTGTIYYSKAQMLKLLTPYASNISFVEDVYIRHHFGRVRRYLFPLLKRFPFVASLFSTFYTRVLFFQKDKAANPVSSVRVLVETSSHL